MRQKLMLLLSAILLLSVVLSACGTPTTAQSGTLNELPTAPPAPTYPPAAKPSIPPAPATTLPKAGVSALVVDQFDGTLDTWQVLDLRVLPGSELSTWKVTEGRVDQVTGPDGMNASTPTALLIGDTTWTNYRVQAMAYARGNSIMGLVGRNSDKGMYMLVVRPADSQGGSQITIQRYDAATETFTNLAKADGGGAEKNQWYALELAFQGNSITALINGQEVLQTTDATYSAGRAGVYGYAEGELSFDNFSVQ